MSAGKPEKKNRTQSTRTHGAARGAVPARAEASVEISAVIRALSREWPVARRLSKRHAGLFTRTFGRDGSIRHRVRSGKLLPPACARGSAGYSDGHGDNGDTGNHVDHVVAAFGGQRQQHEAVQRQDQGKQTAA